MKLEKKSEFCLKMKQFRVRRGSRKRSRSSFQESAVLFHPADFDRGFFDGYDFTLQANHGFTREFLGI
jgi:hypothetical protein